MGQPLHELIGDMNISKVNEVAQDILTKEIDYKGLLNELVKGLEIVGQKYVEGEYFIADLIVAGMAVKDIFNKLDFKGHHENLTHMSGTVLIGTIYEDIHDIGKDIVVDALKVYGFRVIDIGVDVPVDVFLENVKRIKPDILAVSCVMSGSFKFVLELCNELEEQGLTKDMKIVVGGAAIDKRLSQISKIPFLTSNIFEGLDYCISVVKKEKENNYE